MYLCTLQYLLTKRMAATVPSRGLLFADSSLAQFRLSMAQYSSVLDQLGSTRPSLAQPGLVRLNLT
jgi:hypothetical protein